MSRLTLEHAERIISAARAEGRLRGLRALTIAVLDDGGHLIAFAREDGPGAALRPQMAVAKAFGAVGIGRGGTRLLEKLAVDRPHFVEALGAISGGRILPVAGGVMVLDTEENVIGGVGISGDTSDNDELCALAGVAAAGLVADTGARD